MRLDGVAAFTERMIEVGNRCELHVYDGRGHLFTGDDEDYIDTMTKADSFLISLGYLQGEPNPDAILTTRVRFPSDVERWSE